VVLLRDQATLPDDVNLAFETMPTQVTGSGLLSLVADYGSEAPKSQLVAAAGYIKPDGKLAWTAFYEALLEAKGITPRVSNDEDREYDELSSEAQGLYDEIHERIGEKWDHAEIIEMLGKVQDLGIETADQFADALSFVADDPWHWQRDFVESLTNDAGIFSWVVIDHEATWESSLRYDYSEVEFDGSVFVFSNSF
jgi:hypothetical protein